MGHFVPKQPVRAPAACGWGFTIVELLAAVGIVACLAGLILTAVAGARRSARQAVCATHLRQIGSAVWAYAADNDGWAPRDATLGRADRAPWPVLLAPYVGQAPAPSLDALAGVDVYQCPAHPATGAPTGYVVNAFAFETQPDWRPDGPVVLRQIPRPAALAWVLEAADSFPWRAPPAADKVMGVEYHDAYHPRHLPGGERHRISDDRHDGRANVLYLDGRVEAVVRGGMTLDMFDDGLTRRATPMPEPESPAGN